MSSLLKHPDAPESLAKMAEGHSGVGSTTEPIQKDARQSSQSAVLGNVLKSKRATSSMEESAEEKVQQRIRAASLCCDVRRTGLVSTQFTSKDTVRVLNDQTGQSIVVASNQSTRDALASLVQRESEAEKKEAAAVKLAKEESELRAMMMEQQTKKFIEEQDLKKLESSSTSPPRPRPHSAQPKRRNNYRQQAFTDPMAITTQEAQALLITYLNYTQPEFSGLSYQFLTEQHGIAPVLPKMQPPAAPPPQKPKRSSSHRPKTTKATKKDSATTTAIVFDTSPPILVNQLETKPAIVPNVTPPTIAPQNNRAYFGISRFLDSTEGTVVSATSATPAPAAPAKPKKAAKKPACRTIKMSMSTETAEKKTTTRKQTIKAPVISEGSETKMEEVVTAAAPVPCEPSPADTNATQRSIIFNDPMVAIASAIHEHPSEPARQPEPVPEDPERSRLFLWAPGTRSNRGKSDSPSLHKTDAELIEFLRKPLEKAREEEREAARRKMMDPSPKRKSRTAGNNGNASKSSNSSTSTSNQPPTTDSKTLDSQTLAPIEATLQDSLLASQSPPCDFLDDHLLDSAFEDYDFSDFQQQQTTDLSSGTTESYRSLCLDMPLGQAMAEVPLESIAGHLQTQKELFFMKKEGKLPDKYQTGEQQHQSSSGIEPTSLSKKKSAPKRKQPPKSTTGDGAETAQPKRKRAPPKKKSAQVAQEQQVQNVVHVDSQMQLYQPTHHAHSQPSNNNRLPSVDNLLPPINGQYQQANYGRGGSQETNGQSSSASYQSYQYSMNTQAERPNKQQSLASMLQPLNNTGAGSSQGQQPAVADNYQNGMMHTMGSNGNGGEYYGYEDHNSQMSTDYTGDGRAHFAPLSVESHISYQSQESNSHMSSMPQTPISNHGSVYNNPVVNDNQMSYTQHNYGQQSDLYAIQEYFATVENHHQYQNANTQNGVSFASDLRQQQNGQQEQQQFHQQPHQQPLQQPLQQPQPVGELHRLTPTDIADFFDEPAVNGSFNCNISQGVDNGNSYSNGQILVSNDNVRIMPDGRQEILNFVGEDEECEMSTCPADCNKCQSKEATPNLPVEVVQDTMAVVVQKHTPNVTNGTTILQPDSEQISYVQYLSPTGNRNLSEPVKPPPKRKPRSKKKADPKSSQHANLLHGSTLDTFPENMSIGELLKKRSQFHPNVFINAANRSMPQLALMENTDGALSSTSPASGSPGSSVLSSAGPLSLVDVQMMVDSRTQRDVEGQSHSDATPLSSDTEVEPFSPMDVQPPAQLVVKQPSPQKPVQPVTYQRIPPPPHRRILKAVRRRPTPPSQPSSGDPVLDTIQTVISNVMGVNDALEQYLPVEELNIPANIKAQHKKAIETAKQHQAHLKKQAEKAENAEKQQTIRNKLPSVQMLNNSGPDIVVVKHSPAIEVIKDVIMLDDDSDIELLENDSVITLSGNRPNITMEELRMILQNQLENEPTLSSIYFKGPNSLAERMNTNKVAQQEALRQARGEENDIFRPDSPVKILTEEEIREKNEKMRERVRLRNEEREKMLQERRKLHEYLRQKKEREDQQKMLQDQQNREQQQYQQDEQDDNVEQQHWNQQERSQQHQAEEDCFYQDQPNQQRRQQQPQQQYQPLAQRVPQPQQQLRQQPHQPVYQQRVHAQSSSDNSQNGQAVIQHFKLPPRYPSKLAQMLQKPHGAPYTMPNLMFDQPSCQPSTSLQAAQLAAQQEAEFEAMEAARQRSPMFIQRPNPDITRVQQQDMPSSSSSNCPANGPPGTSRPTGSKRAAPTGSQKKTSTPLSRSYRVRECMKSVIAYGPLTPEEALGRSEGVDTEEFNQEYMEHWNRTTQDMIDNPCVPEITVDDVLENPELEPALHGRFRKRLAAVRAGKTTMTKPPQKKKRKTDDDCCTATTTQQSTSTTSHTEPSTSTATTTKSCAQSTTTIKAIVVPSLDLLPDASASTTSTEVLSQPLSVLTNDNTNSMGPSPLVSGVQTPVEPNLNNQQLNYIQEDMNNQFSSTPYSYTAPFDGHNTYNRTVGNPMPYNILEGEDDVADEEELRRIDEDSRQLLVDTNQVDHRRAPSTHFSFDELMDNGPRGALINDNNDPFLGVMDHDLSMDDSFFSGQQRPRGPFDFDDEDFDIDKDIIDLNGSDNAGPATPSDGILDDPPFDSVFFH